MSLAFHSLWFLLSTDHRPLRICIQKLRQIPHQHTGTTSERPTFTQLDEFSMLLSNYGTEAKESDFTQAIVLEFD